MERTEFINLAPEYYMLAFYIYANYPQSTYSEDDWMNAFTVEQDGDHTLLIPNEALRAEAIRILVAQEALTALDDPFGPTLWLKAKEYVPFIERMTESPYSPFFKAEKSGDAKRWLMRALVPLNKMAGELRITPADFSHEPIDEWKPIQISQSEPTVAEAIEKVGAAAEAIEQDNGYAASHPQERDLVVHDLKGGIGQLKSDSISVGWIRRTLGALKTAGGRFANTVKGQAIDGAMLALKEFVKKHMGEVFDRLFSLWP